MAHKDGKVQRVRRNDPCPCLSGLKWKKCCGRVLPDRNYLGTVKLRGDSSAPTVGEKPGYTIVKVQAPLRDDNTIDTNGPCMIYNRNREDPRFSKYLPYEQVADKMRGRQKAFFYATISFGQLVLHEEAPAQGW